MIGCLMLMFLVLMLLRGTVRVLLRLSFVLILAIMVGSLLSLSIVMSLVVSCLSMFFAMRLFVSTWLVRTGLVRFLLGVLLFFLV